MRTLPVVLGILALGTLYPAWKSDFTAAPAPTAERPDATPFGKKVSSDRIADFRVVEWDEAQTGAKILEVKRSGTDWVIPSHNNYPADANDRVAKATETFLGVDKGRPVTDDAAQYEDLGVIDPLDENLSKNTQGRGKRVTMVDDSGETVLDLIIGKRVDTSEGLFYVREKDAKEVYTAKVDPAELSTRFTDYVEVDPLKIKREDVRGMTVADYSVDIKNGQGQVVERASTDIARVGTEDSWSTSSPTPPDKRLSQATVTSILNAATAIKLTDVRVFNPRDMTAKGFYFEPYREGMPNDGSPIVPTADGTYRIIGNQGRLGITTKDGLRYSLMFGDVALDTDSAKDAKQGKDKNAATPDKDKGHDRYCMVFVAYDPNLDETAAKEQPPKKPGEPETKKPTGQERAARAQKRFLQYYYVISDDDFKLLRPGLDKLFEAKPPEPKVGNTGKTVSQWLADNGRKPGVTTTASGLQYQILTPARADGRGPLASDSVSVRYKGTLAADGSQFDATPGSETRTFGVTGVIKGWTEMLQLMREGEKVRIWVKPELGYGEAGSPPKIPANSILVFEIELVKVVGTGRPAPPPTSALPPAHQASPAPAAPPPAKAK